MLSTDLSRHVDKFYGKYAGIVADQSEPDNQGRIMVQVPSVFGAALPIWARPCLPYGHFYLPPPGTRIWVEFEAGNTAYPIWVGVWYPDGQAPAETQAAPQTARVIQTTFGHTIEISDAKDAEKVVIRHGNDSFLALQPDGSVILSNTKGAHLHLNATDNETTLMSEAGHLVTMTGDALVLAGSGGTTVELKGDTVTILAAKVVVSGTSVLLGADASERVVLGAPFKALWNLVMTHVHPTGVGPSGPPTPPLMPMIDAVHLSSAVSVK